MLNIPDYLPQLATGSHPIGSGNACIMNFISYLSGEDEISDTPVCVDLQVALVMQYVNDSICWHGFTEQERHSAMALITLPDVHIISKAGESVTLTPIEESYTSTMIKEQPDKLCSACSHIVFMLGQRCMNTALALSSADRIRLATSVADRLAAHDPEFVPPSHILYLRMVEKMLTGTHPEVAKEIAEGNYSWLTGPVHEISTAAGYYGAVVDNPEAAEVYIQPIANYSAGAIGQSYDCMMENEHIPNEAEFDPDARAQRIKELAEFYLNDVERIIDNKTDYEFTEAEYRRVKEMANI